MSRCKILNYELVCGRDKGSEFGGIDELVGRKMTSVFSAFSSLQSGAAMRP